MIFNLNRLATMCEVYKEYVHSNNELLRANFSKKKNKQSGVWSVLFLLQNYVIP